MKKLQKLSLTSNENEFKIIGAREADSLRGGYTQAQMDSMMANGTWNGGYVDGMGYVAGEVTVYANPTGSAPTQTVVQMDDDLFNYLVETGVYDVIWQYQTEIGSQSSNQPCPACALFDEYWGKGVNVADYNSGAFVTPIGEVAIKSLMPGHSASCGYHQ